MGLISKRSVGIRIDGEQATIVEVEKYLGRIRLLRDETFPLAQATDQRADNRAPFQGLEEVIVGLPGRSLILRFLELPNVDDRDLTGLLAYELERHLPFPAEEACYSFQNLRRRGNVAEVLVVAARRADVECVIQQVERLGLKPTAVDAAPLGAVNALLSCEPQSRKGVISLIYANGRKAEVSVVSEGVLASSRAVPLDASLDPLLSEIGRISAVVPQAPERVLVDAQSEDLCHSLTEELGCRAEPWSPVKAAVDLAAFGLALKGVRNLPLRIDLLPAERGRKRRERVVSVMCALLGLVGVLGAAWAVSDAYLERRTLRQLDQQLAEVKAEAAAVASVKAEWAKLRANLELLGGLAGDREMPLLVLKELVALLPPDAMLTEFSLEGNRVRIGGSTTSSASELISAFERSSLFENAAFTSPIAAQGKDRQGFQIEAFVKGRSAIVDRGPRPGARR